MPEKRRMKLIIKKVLNPLTFLRAMLGAIALLHLALFIRRLVEGNWTTMLEQTRLVLALAASIYGFYCSFQLERLVIFSIRAPRKMLALTLIVLIGHLTLYPSTANQRAESSTRSDPWSPVLLVIPTVLGAFMLLGGLIRKALRAGPRRSPHRATFRNPNRLSPPDRRWRMSPLCPRPPPFLHT